MKKILEIVQYGETDIRFNTDIDVLKRPQDVETTIAKTCFSMATKLRGSKEINILAMIRAMAIADLAISRNRGTMIKELDRSSEQMAKSFMETIKAMNGSYGVSIEFENDGDPRPETN